MTNLLACLEKESITNLNSSVEHYSEMQCQIQINNLLILIS